MLSKNCEIFGRETGGSCGRPGSSKGIIELEAKFVNNKTPRGTNLSLFRDLNAVAAEYN